MFGPTGKEEEEVVTVHPRAMFIPQDGWTFLAAGSKMHKLKRNNLGEKILTIFLFCLYTFVK